MKLHSSHEDEPEEVGLLVVSAGDDLVFNEGVFDLLIVSVFPFVVSNEDKGRVEPSQEISQQKVQKVFVVVEENNVVDRN